MSAPEPTRNGPLGFLRSIAMWFDSGLAGDRAEYREQTETYKIDWVRMLPFLALHVMCLGVIWVGVSPIAVGVCALMYVLRMFALTGFYHRYFSHKTFKTNRFWQLVLALWGMTAVQKGPLWWASHHREHHRNSDGPGDVHSPIQHGFFWSHIGWVMGRSSRGTNWAAIKDLAKYPELRWLDRFHVLVPIAFATGLYFLGAWLERAHPALGTSGMQMLIWGFFISTVVLFHCAVSINSLAHLVGKRRFPTTDQSRNSWWLAIVTMGEGWHNNHHHYPASTRQGFYWWEVDLTYYGLRLMAALRIIRDLKPPPQRILDQGRALDAGETLPSEAA